MRISQKGNLSTHIQERESDISYFEYFVGSMKLRVIQTLQSVMRVKRAASVITRLEGRAHQAQVRATLNHIHGSVLPVVA
jgi:hypothetical protein